MALGILGRQRAARSAMTGPSQPPPVAPGNRFWRGPALTVAVATVHLAVWVTAVAPTGLPLSRQIVAEFFSTLAVLGISANLVLACRLRVLERWFQGLDKVFVAHRRIGLGIPVLLLAHFVIVPMWPTLTLSKLLGLGNLAFVIGVVFLASAPRMPWRGLVTMKYQTWKTTHRLNGLMLVIAFTHLSFAPAFVRASPALLAYVYGIFTIGLGAWLYRELAFAQLRPVRQCRVETASPRSASVLEVVLDDSAPALPRRAGQFVFVSFAAGPTREDHPFTVSSGPGQSARLSIKASGDFTDELLDGLPTGSGATIEGPYGGFDFSRGLRRQLWIAGGIGITPFLAMAAALDSSHEVELVWSVHNRADAIYADELDGVADARPNLRVTVHVTAEQGHLDVTELPTLQTGPDCSVFICGPVPMRAKVLRDLKRLAIPRREVYFEEFRLR